VEQSSCSYTTAFIAAIDGVTTQVCVFCFQNELHTNQLFFTGAFGTNHNTRFSLACMCGAHVLVCRALE